jgi:hypothetical protein
VLLSKKDIRARIALGDLTVALASALEFATKSGIAEAVNGLTVLSGDLETQRQLMISGQVSFEEQSRAQARIAFSLTQWLELLPESPNPASAKKMLEEGNFKNRILWLLLLSKVLVIGYLWYHWSTGAFSKMEFFAALGLLAPALAAYGSVILSDYLRIHREGRHQRRFVSGPLVRIAFWVFPIYAFSLVYFIKQKAQSNFSFEEMNTGLVLVESLLGGYVGQIVGAFFKKE